jgi:hypothetical protein
MRVIGAVEAGGEVYMDIERKKLIFRSRKLKRLSG